MKQKLHVLQWFLIGMCCAQIGTAADLELLDEAGSFRPGLYQAKGNANNQWSLTMESSVIPVEVVPGPVMANVMGTEAGCATAAEAYVNPVTGTSYHWNKQNTTFGYFGEIYLEAGVTYVFGKYIDDAAQISIGDPATLVLNHTTWNTFGTGSYTASTTGWVPIKILIADGTGGKGPPNAAGINGTGLGMAYNRTGATAQNSSDWQTVMDPGDMSLFRVAVSDSVNPIQGSVKTASGYTLTLKGGESDAVGKVYYGATGTDVSTWATTAEVTIPAQGTCSVTIPWTGADAPSILIRSEGTDALGVYSSQTEPFSLASNLLRDVNISTLAGTLNRVQVRGTLLFCASQPSAQVTLTLSAGGSTIATRVQTVACGEEFLFDVSDLPFSTTATYTVKVENDLSSAVSGDIVIPRDYTTLYWGGAATGTWADGHPGAEVGGWQDADGNPLTFKNGDSVVFGTAPQAVTITSGGWVTVDDFLCNAESAYTIVGDRNRYSHTANNGMASANTFEKRGSGTLTFQNFCGSWTCDMYLREGAFSQGNQTLFDATLTPTNTCFGDMTVAHTVYVGGGDSAKPASVSLSYSGNMGFTQSDYRATGNVTEFNLTLPDFVTPVSFVLEGVNINSAGSLVLGSLTLRDGANVTRQGNAQSGLYFNDEVRVLRNADDSAGAACFLGSVNHYGLESNAPFTFYVEEITSEDGEPDTVADLSVSSFGDSNHPKLKSTSTWVKTGPGLMKMENQAFGYHGDFVIREGTVLFPKAPTFGANEAGRKFIVEANGTMRRTDTDGWYNQSFKGTTIVSNGVLRLESYSHLGNLELYGDPTLECVGWWAHMGNGTLRFDEYLYLELDHPKTYSLSSAQLECFVESEEYEVVPETGDPVLHTKGYTRFTVKEQTAEPSAIDVVLKGTLNDSTRTLQNNSSVRTTHSGLLKDGSGVLSFDGDTTYDYQTKVAEGGLFLAKSTASLKDDVVVCGRAAVGGTSTLQKRLVIENLGGFLVDATNVTAQLKVRGDLVLPKNVVMMVCNVEAPVSEMGPLVTGIPLPQVDGSLIVDGNEIAGYEELNTKTWRVNLKGVEQEISRNFRVRLEEDNTLTILPDYTASLICVR